MAVVVFDVNETLLDLSALDGYFERALGDPAPRGEWFASMLRAGMVGTITGRYQSFAELAVACLHGQARRLGRDVGDGAELMREFAHAPPHPDVRPALTRLKNAGTAQEPKQQAPAQPSYAAPAKPRNQAPPSPPSS